MSANFERLVQDVPQDVITQTKAVISAKVAFFRPRAYIVNQVMCSEDYNIILPSSPLPPARIGRHEYECKKDSLVVIGSGLEYLSTKLAPTREYVNIMINREFFEAIALEVTGYKTRFVKVEYARTQRLLRLVADLEHELSHYQGADTLMLQSILTQLVIQLLRDSGEYTGLAGRTPSEHIDYGLASEYQQFLNQTYLALVNRVNELLPIEAKLTEREIEVATYLLERFDYDSIAHRLYISPNTLKTHVKHIYHKLDVAGRKELALRLTYLGNR